RKPAARRCRQRRSPPPGRRCAGISACGALHRPLSSYRSSEPLQPVLDAEQRERAEADGDEQDHALEKRLPQRVKVEDEEQVADRAESESSEDRADGAAAPAEQR